MKKRVVLVGWACLIVFTVLVLYRDLFNTFFTQDEWWELGRAVDAQTQGIGYYFKPWGGHVVPLMLFFVNLQFRLFGTNIWPYAAIAILGHSLIAIALALFVGRLTRRMTVGWLSGLVFVVNTAPFHAVTYIAGGVTHIHGATFLFLISLIFFAKYIQSGYRRGFFYLSLVSIILAVFFMEYVAFYFFLVPFANFFFSHSHRKKKKAFWFDQLVLLGVGLAFFVFRFLSQKINIYGSQFIGARTVESAALRVESPVWDYFSMTFRNTQKLLPRVFYQVWMNEDLMSRVSRLFGTVEDFLKMMPILMILFIIFTCWLLVRQHRFFEVKIALMAAVVLVAGAFPAYIFPTFPNVIESRYLYVPALGLAVVVSLFLITAAEMISGCFKSRLKGRIVGAMVMAAVLLPFFGENYRHITGRLKDTVAISKMRQKILRQTLEYYPQIGSKSVFYATSNLSTPGIPWPVSLGYTFLVMHTYQGNYQGGLEFFRSNKLWPVTEGYEEHGEYGFGLFFDFENLIKTLRQYHLSEENVYAICWEASQDSRRNLLVTHAQPPIYEGEMIDMSGKIRPLVKGVLANKKDLSIAVEVAKYFSPEIELSFDRQSEATWVDGEGRLRTIEPSLPRLTTGGQGKGMGVLVEGYATNNLLFSEDFTQAVWEKSSEVRVRGDIGEAPNGQKTAEELIFGDETERLGQKIFYPIRDKGKGEYTFSVYLKAPTRKGVTLALTEEGGGVTEREVLVEPFWQRFEVTASLPIGGPFEAVLTGVKGEIEVWGGQVEETPHSTSYIATTGKSAFRAGDVFRAYPKKSLPMGKGTVGLWFKPEWKLGNSLDHILFYNGETTYKNSVKIEVDRGVLRFNVMDADGGSKSIEQRLESVIFKEKEWNQVVATWSNKGMVLYLNGRAVGQVRGLGTGKPKEGLSFGDPFRIGVHHGWYSMYADAILANLEHYPRQLSSSEVKGLYTSQRGRFE